MTHSKHPDSFIASCWWMDLFGVLRNEIEFTDVWMFCSQNVVNSRSLITSELFFSVCKYCSMWYFLCDMSEELLLLLVLSGTVLQAMASFLFWSLNVTDNRNRLVIWSTNLTNCVPWIIPLVYRCALVSLSTFSLRSLSPVLFLISYYFL